MYPPRGWRQAHRVVKRAGASKPTSLVLYQGDEAQWYGNIAGHHDDRPLSGAMAAVGQFLAAHSQDASGHGHADRPVIAVIQSFDWTGNQSVLPGEENLRPPTEPRTAQHDIQRASSRGERDFLLQLRRNAIEGAKVSGTLGGVKAGCEAKFGGARRCLPPSMCGGRRRIISKIRTRALTPRSRLVCNRYCCG